MGTLWPDDGALVARTSIPVGAGLKRVRVPPVKKGLLMGVNQSSSDAVRDLVVLVHGGVSGGHETWAEQLTLSGTYDLVAPDRQGYGLTAPDAPDDPFVDAVTISALLGEGAHLVGYSMGGMVAMLAAARNPHAVRSLVLVEPVAFDLVRGRADVEAFIAGYQTLLTGGEDAEHFLREFLVFFGNDPAEVAQIPDPMPEGLRKAAVALFTGAAPWDVPTPVRQLAEASYPVVVVSGGHSDMFEAICDELADRVGAQRAIISGAGHAAQFTGEPFNALLRATWEGASPQV